MWRTVVILAVAVRPLLCQNPAPGLGESKAMSMPALPYLDRGACPFEGCTYREWTATKAVIVYDTWEDKRKTVGRLAAGEKVTGITGVVITVRPGVIRMDRDLPERGLRAGDTVLVYTNLGEGFAKVWFKGRFYSEFDITFAAWPDHEACGRAKCVAAFTDLGKSAWWAQVKLSSGRMGWVEMDNAGFDGVDQLAGLAHLTAAGA